MPNQEVIRYTLDLLETMEEGLVYIKQKLGELNVEGTLTVLTDTISAFATVEKSMITVVKKLPENNEILEKADRLRKAFNMMVREYEDNRGQKALEILQFTLEPAFKNWKEELEDGIRKYITS